MAPRMRLLSSADRPGRNALAQPAMFIGTRRLTTRRPASVTSMRSWRGPAGSAADRPGPAARRWEKASRRGHREHRGSRPPLRASARLRRRGAGSSRRQPRFVAPSSRRVASSTSISPRSRACRISSESSLVGCSSARPAWAAAGAWAALVAWPAAAGAAGPGSRWHGSSRTPRRPTAIGSGAALTVAGTSASSPSGRHADAALDVDRQAGQRLEGQVATDRLDAVLRSGARSRPDLGVAADRLDVQERSAAERRSRCRPTSWSGRPRSAGRTSGRHRPKR